MASWVVAFVLCSTRWHLLHKHAARSALDPGRCPGRMAATRCRTHRHLGTSNGAANRAARPCSRLGFHLGAVQEGSDLPHKGVWVLERHQLCGEREAEADDVAPLTVLLRWSGAGECCWTVLPRPSPHAIVFCPHSAPVGINKLLHADTANQRPTCLHTQAQHAVPMQHPKPHYSSLTCPASGTCTRPAAISCAASCVWVAGGTTRSWLPAMSRIWLLLLRSCGTRLGPV